MQHRFRFIGEWQGDGRWTLSGDEALHLSKILRLPLDTAVEVTDGQGRWAHGVIAAISNRDVTVLSVEPHLEPLPQLLLEFAIGALKPGAVDDILPALTELGIDRVHVFHQQDSAKSRLQPKVIERWQRILVQSSKQCKRAWLPQVAQYDSVAHLTMQLAAPSEPTTTQKILLRGLPGDPGLPRLLTAKTGRVVVVAGGEKGLASAEEQALLDSGYQPASLGPFVLRAVTAAVAAAATMSLHRVDLC